MDFAEIKAEHPGLSLQIVALIDYVTNFSQIGTKSKKLIRELCESQEPWSGTLYRGHYTSKQIRKGEWYSASKSEKVAREQFSTKGKCCVFHIHLIHVPVIDVNNLVGEYINLYSEEEEFIFLGGGTFYANSDMTEEGFAEIKPGVFECWYTFLRRETPKKSNHG